MTTWVCQQCKVGDSSAQSSSTTIQKKGVSTEEGSVHNEENLIEIEFLNDDDVIEICSLENVNKKMSSLGF